MAKNFEDLSEQEILALAISLEETDARIYAEHSLGINVNLGWGVALLLFGGIMLGFALRARARSRKR